MCRLKRVVAGSLRESVDCRLFIETALVDARGVAGPFGDCLPSGDGILTGKGNSELRFLFLRGSLKNVVCVDTVWVVVVVLP